MNGCGRSFSQSIFYHQSEFEDADGYHGWPGCWMNWMRQGAGGNRLFYLSTSPEYFPIVLEQLESGRAASGRARQMGAGGYRKTLRHRSRHRPDISTTRSTTPSHEKDTYRIDHYLGKETAQNLMVLRFANAIFEPLWNSRYINHVQITCAENLGMEGGRGGYYEKAGALRDMVQNHLLQLLSLVAMEPPTDLSADGVRDEKVKVIRSLRQFTDAAEVARNVVRAPIHRRPCRWQPGASAIARKTASTRNP